MNKLWITLLCVFLALLIIGCVVYPRRDMQGTIDGIKSDFSPIFSAFTYASNFIRSSLNFLTGTTYEDKISAVITNKEIIYYNLSLFIPYHLEKYNLYDRCTNQDWNWFVSKVDAFHTEHKVCLLRCQLRDYDGFGYAEEGGIIDIFYCGYCNSIVAMFFYTVKVELGKKYLYPYDKSGQDVDTLWVGLVANTFRYSEVIDYLY